MPDLQFDDTKDFDENIETFLLHMKATFSDDNFKYSGTWHYPDGSNDDAMKELIEYKRIM